MKKLQNLEKCIFCCFAGGPQRYPTLSVLISDPRKIAKPGKKHFFLFCGMSQNLEKLQKLEKCIFCWFPGRVQCYPTLSVLISDPRKIAKPGKSIFCWFPGRVQRYPTLSVLISDPRKIAKPGKKHFLLFCGRSQKLKKLQNLEKCIFCCFAGGPQRYPTLSNAIRPYPKPWKNCKTWKNAFFAGFREGPNAIQRYPSLSQTLEKLQNLEKCIFCCFAGGPKLGKIAKPGKMHFLLVSGKAPTLSNAIRPYPRP